jgi:hypothetical protein
MPGKEVGQIGREDSGLINDDGGAAGGVIFELKDEEIENIDSTYGEYWDFDNLPEGVVLSKPNFPREVGLAFSRSHGPIPRG